MAMVLVTFSLTREILSFFHVFLGIDCQLFVLNLPFILSQNFFLLIFFFYRGTASVNK